MRFYVVDDGIHANSLGTEFAYPGGVERGPAPTCPVCGSFIGMLQPIMPYRFYVETYGRGFGDVGFGPACRMFCTERFREAWQGSSLTGIEAFSPVEILGVRRKRRFTGNPPPYYLLTIVHTQAAMDEKAAHLIRDSTPPVCPVCRWGGVVKGHYGIFFEKGSVEPYDLFHARGTTLLFASERYKEFQERHGITNSTLIPCEEYIPPYFKPEENDPRYLGN